MKGQQKLGEVPAKWKMTNDTHICQRSKKKPRNYKLLGFISALEGYEANSSITIFWAHEREEDLEHSESLIISDQAS